LTPLSAIVLSTIPITKSLIKAFGYRLMEFCISFINYFYIIGMLLIVYLKNEKREFNRYHIGYLLLSGMMSWAFYVVIVRKLRKMVSLNIEALQKIETFQQEKAQNFQYDDFTDDETLDDEDTMGMMNQQLPSKLDRKESSSKPMFIQNLEEIKQLQTVRDLEAVKAEHIKKTSNTKNAAADDSSSEKKKTKKPKGNGSLEVSLSSSNKKKKLVEVSVKSQEMVSVEQEKLASVVSSSSDPLD